MKKIKYIIVAVAVAVALFAIVAVLRNDHALVTHPKGVMAHKELHVIKRNILLMLTVIVPTFVLLGITLWKNRTKNTKAKSQSKAVRTPSLQVALWVIPSIVVAVLSVKTWHDAHALDPYRPLKSDVKPLTIQVVALDWKWLFIYPEQGIATVNWMQFPEKTPIHLELAADGSPMNSFWIPQLSGQIYSMSGMTTQLHLMADGVGEYTGKAAEINGKGYADMTFVAKSTSPLDFEEWVSHVKQSPLHLTDSEYHGLVQPSLNYPVQLYSDVPKDLFNHIVMKYMSHQ